MIGIDSDCIIDFLNGDPKAVEAVRKYKEEIVTTEINIFEVFFGIYTNKNISKNHEEDTQLFFDSIKILNIDGWGIKAAKLLTNLIKKGKIVEQNDCLIASIMLAKGCNKIITRNIKHFSRISDIEAIPY